MVLNTSGDVMLGVLVGGLAVVMTAGPRNEKEKSPRSKTDIKTKELSRPLLVRINDP
jgi:hypothetical protein